MLTTTNNARFQFLRKALVLPVTFAAVVALSVSATETKATPTFQQPKKAVVQHDTVPEPAMTITVDTSLKLPNRVKIKSKIPANLLYYINGSVASVEEVSKLEPKEIKSINVWKDKAAVDRWGKAGANGVIEILLNETKLIRIF